MSNNFEFQKAGEVCENCRERWENAKLPTKKLFALPSYTMRYHSSVAICPYCDGGEITKLAVANIKRREANVIRK